MKYEEPKYELVLFHERDVIRASVDQPTITVTRTGVVNVTIEVPLPGSNPYQ